MHRTSFLHLIFLLMCNQGKCEGNFTKTKITETEKDVISKCGNNTKLLPILPGFGWDSLQGTTKSRVLQLSYSQCKTTPDGLFLIPDEVFAIPLKEYTISTQYIEDWRDFKSITAKSFITATGHPLLHIANNDLFHLVKDRQIRLNECTMFVEVRYTMYRVGIERNAEIVRLLQMLLFRVEEAFEEDDEPLADYLLQHIVQDYGTHFLTSVDVGGIILQEDFLSKEKTEINQLKKSDISVLATAAFKKNFRGFPAGLDQMATVELNPSDLQIYDTLKKDSIIQVIGGAPLDTNKTIYLWGSTVQNHLESIDHRGDPLHELISSTDLPISANVSEVLRAKLIKIVDEYYTLNTHKGCMEKDDPNFDVSANIDDGSCEKPFHQNLFGGIYQTCRPSTGRTITGKLNLCQTKYLNHLNPITENYSCPPSYYEWMLLNQTVSLNTTSQDCWDSCDGWWVFQKCHKECKTIYNYNEARYFTFWCVPRNKISSSNGFLFGGAYSSSSNNDITKRKLCPPTFTAFSAGEDIKICASLDHKAGYKYSVPFGGFYSCSKSNPLVTKDSYSTNYNMHCSSGYVSHLVHSLQNCNLYYCSKAKKVPKPSRPTKTILPFISSNASLYLSIVKESLDLISEEEEVEEININQSNNNVMATGNNFCLFPETIGTDITNICQNITTEFNTVIGNNSISVIIKCENGTARKMVDYKNGTGQIQDSKNNADINQSNISCIGNENGTSKNCVTRKNDTDQKRLNSDYTACWNSGNGSVCADKKNDNLNTVRRLNKTCINNDNETFATCDEDVSSKINEDKILIMDAQNKSTQITTLDGNWNITNISTEGIIVVPPTDAQLTTLTVITNMSWPGAKNETKNIENVDTVTTAVLITICVVTCLTIISVIGYCLWRRKKTSLKIDNNQITLGPV